LLYPEPYRYEPHVTTATRADIQYPVAVRVVVRIRFPAAQCAAMQ
jgi:hypothetical protein